MRRKLTSYQLAESLCIRHLANRHSMDLVGNVTSIFEYRPEKRSRAAFPNINPELIAKIDFDLAFNQLDEKYQRILLLWYGISKLDTDKIADILGVSRRTLFRRRRSALIALAQQLEYAKLTA